MLAVLVLFTLSLVATMLAASEERTHGRKKKWSSSNSDDSLAEMNSAKSQPPSDAPKIKVVQLFYPCLPYAQVNASSLLQLLLALPLYLCSPILSAPSVLRKLFVADLLSWMAVMAHAMYCTDYVATVVYSGRPNSVPGSQDELSFDEGVRMGALGLLLHSVIGIRNYVEY